jgi:acetyl-CoA carboxylase biotin carboxyl carrier protein
MTIEEIRELLRVFNESGVAELELQQGKDRLRIRKAVSEDSAVHSAPLPSIFAAPALPAAGGPPSPQAPVAASPELAEAESGQVLVKSPIVGTFYESPSPGSPPFVKVGDAVEPGQVLCIIESMKLMNEIEAEVGGVVAAKLVENGRPVEYGEALFAIQTR